MKATKSKEGSRGKGEPPGRVAGYVRVSSASQTSAMQRDAIERASDARGEPVGRWYEDRFTGGGPHPLGLVEVLQHAREGKFTKLYVYRLDRLSRRGIRDLLTIVHDLEACGVELVTLADGFDLDGSARDVVLAVLAWAAQMERAAIGERISAARIRVEAKGGSWGRPKRLQPYEERKVRELAHDGYSNREIAARLKIPRATVWRTLAQKGGSKLPAKNAPRGTD